MGRRRHGVSYSDALKAERALARLDRVPCNRTMQRDILSKRLEEPIDLDIEEAIDPPMEEEIEEPVVPPIDYDVDVDEPIVAAEPFHDPELEAPFFGPKCNRTSVTVYNTFCHCLSLRCPLFALSCHRTRSNQCFD
jgi:hypothetical protein